MVGRSSGVVPPFWVPVRAITPHLPDFISCVDMKIETVLIYLATGTPAQPLETFHDENGMRRVAARKFVIFKHQISPSVNMRQYTKNRHLALQRGHSESCIMETGSAQKFSIFEHEISCRVNMRHGTHTWQLARQRVHSRRCITRMRCAP